MKFLTFAIILSFFISPAYGEHVTKEIYKAQMYRLMELAQMYRDCVHQKLLMELIWSKDTDRTRRIKASPIQIDNYLALIEAVTNIENKETEYITCEEIIKSKKIFGELKPLLSFYLTITGCIDQMAISREAWLNDPFGELLFFKSNGQKIEEQIKAFDISPFSILVDKDAAFVRINKVKCATISIPLWWFREDANFLLLRDTILLKPHAELIKYIGYLNEIKRIRLIEYNTKKLSNISETDGLLKEFEKAIQSKYMMGVKP